MKPELLLLAKMYSEQYPLLYRLYENNCTIYGHILGMTDEQAQQFHAMMLTEIDGSASGILRVLLENLKKEFPACFETGESIDELIKKISPAFPGKPLSTYKEGFN